MIVRRPSVCPIPSTFLPALLILLIALQGCASTGHRPSDDARSPAITESPGAGTATVPGPSEPVEFAQDDDELFAMMLEPVEEPGPDEDLVSSPHDELATADPVLTPEAAEIERMLIEDSQPSYDIPMVLNDKVLAWVEYYSKKHADQFEPGLVRSGRYLPMIREIFGEEGLPLDLAYMAHVESSYKTNAYSRARAKGVFQFIASTGRNYGLHIDYWVDERSDPEKSARAATAYLKDLYAEFGDWYLALAGYNAGEGKIRRALARTGADDFWALTRTRYIRRETKNYVPAILAATLISKDPGRYGFEFTPDDAIEYDTVEIDGAVDLRVLAECAGSDVATLKLLNPALRRNQTPPGRTTDVRVPVGKAEVTLAALAEVPEDERVLYAHHVIRKGDTLWDISRAYGVSISAIQQANGMGRRTLLKPGRTLKIPTSGAASSSWASAGAGSDPFTYRVQRGDTLGRIARRFDTSSHTIAASNGIRVHDTIYVGQRLKITPGARYGTPSAPKGPATGKTVHTVRRGDTLWEIARAYRSSVDEICSANRISPHATLYPGTKLTVPTR
jgi:membrane-bound lytic murein transglycosylase D